MNKQELETIIPHRNSMMLIDEATKTGENTCEGKKYITGNEWFLDGHFPGNPVVPGVILCEIMAQSSAVIMADISAKSVPFFTGIEKAKFKRQVVPGDTLIFKVKLQAPVRHGMSSMKGLVFVGDEVVTEAEFTARIIQNKKND